MTRDIIAAIDHACADWTTSADAMRWTPEQATPIMPAVQMPTISTEQVAAIQAVLAQASAHMAEQLNAMFAAMAPALQRLGGQIQQLQQIGVVPDDGPSNPMERALWLRRTRNTGPKPTRRAPKTLGPRGGR